MRLRTIARGARRGAALVGLGLAGGAALVTARHALMTPQPLKSGLPGEGRLDRQHGGEVYYSVAGPEDGVPLALLHDFYPGASNYEFRAIYERLAETYRVYAPDWLGFGMSERPPLTLTGEFYAGMLVGFLRDVIGRPAVVVARGRAANIAARAAADAPELFERLALVGPYLEAGERLEPAAGQVVARLFQRAALGLTPYAALSLRPALRLAEGLRSAVGPGQVDDETVDHLYASAHQFGGQYGALALMTGELDLPIQQVFPTLEPPTLLVIGERDWKLPVARLERLAALNPRADLEVILSAGATVYQDQPKLFVGALRRWLGRRIPRQVARRVEARTVAEAVAEAERVEARVPAPTLPPVSPEPGALPVEVAAAPEPAPLEEAPAPVKIVPVLDAPSGQAGKPRIQTRAAPRRERKTAPRAAPAGGRAAPPAATPRKRGNTTTGKAPSGEASPRRRKKT